MIKNQIYMDMASIKVILCILKTYSGFMTIQNILRKANHIAFI